MNFILEMTGDGGLKEFFFSLNLDLGLCSMSSRFSELVVCIMSAQLTSDQCYLQSKRHGCSCSK